MSVHHAAQDAGVPCIALLGAFFRMWLICIAADGCLWLRAQMGGKVSYNGHELHEFLPERTAVYVEQEDQHMPELTVRETLDFSACCQGVGSNAGPH